MAWSFILAAVGILGLWLAGSKRTIGWAVSFGAQGLWIAFALATGQYGFLLSAFAYGFVYARNWWRWQQRPSLVERAQTLVARNRGVS